MQIPTSYNQAIDRPSTSIAKQQQAAGQLQTGENQSSDELKEAFQDFVGQTMFYFNGGRAEEIFQGQLDQVLAEEISDASAAQVADPMFELFMLKRQQ